MKKLLALLFATLLCYSQVEASRYTNDSPVKVKKITVREFPERKTPLAKTVTEIEYEPIDMYSKAYSDEEEDSLQDFSDTDSTTSIEVWNHFSISNSVINGHNCLEIDGNSEKINSDIQNDNALFEKIIEFKGIYQITVRNIPQSRAKEFWSVLADAFTDSDFADSIKELIIIDSDLTGVTENLINISLITRGLNLTLKNCSVDDSKIKKLQDHCNFLKIER